MTASQDDALAREVESIRAEYRRRAVAPQCTGSYSFFNPTHAYLVLERERAILGALARCLRRSLEEVELLDVGSSSGVSLAFLAAYGADPARLHGVDVDESRIERGRSRFPIFDLRFSDGVRLPYDDDSFDVVQQITMLSSVHSDELRREIAAEMLRVLRPGGLVLSYDAAPVPLAPRALNRLLGLATRSRRAASGVTDAASAGSAVTLRPIRPLEGRELETLFAPAVPLEVVRLSPYRPLVDRFHDSRLALARLSASPFATAVLFVARAAAPEP